MDYNKEIKKMKKRRQEYFPVFEMLLKMYHAGEKRHVPVSIEGAPLIALILELIDIGYLDSEAFIVRKNRGDIDALYYNGEYPITESGLAAIRVRNMELKRRHIRIIIIALCLIAITAAALLFFSFS
ncbi:MAG TPA: hypothetical protein PK926_13135 [Spirochaetota bacterium]|nr:hypothetical protein [Spirochaetota bacterium]HPI89577.1 hypothetical protein [Spirochaetota bacterium]HPR49041.1 hypothetical protein [Spirochaetota bacterium]